MKKNAFTLAETLITLMIIGVVAALTIPSLMQVYKDKQLETATKKAMTTVGNGFKLMIANNDGTTEGLPLTQCGEDFSCLSGVFHKAFQIGADKSKTHEGLPEKYAKSGESSDEAGFVWDDVPYIFTTNDGMTYGYLGGFGVVVDLNGNKAPNKICKDVIKLNYESSTVKDKDNNDNNLCEDLNDGIEDNNESNNPLNWLNTPCGTEKKGCYYDTGEFDALEVFDDKGTSLGLVTPNDCSSPTWDKNWDKSNEGCKSLGYTYCVGSTCYKQAN